MYRQYRFIDAGMDDDGSVKVVKDTVFTHINFTAHRFFGRTAIDRTVPLSGWAFK